MTSFPISKTLCLVATITAILLQEVPAQISITGSGFSYTQDFENYSGTNGGLPTGWSVTFSGAATYNGQGNGSSGTGGVWSYGVPSDADRGAGALRSGTPGNITHTVSFINNAGSIITSLRITYNFEQWRYSNTSGFTVSQTGLGSANVSTLSQNGSATGTNGTVTTIPKTLLLSGLSLANGATFSLSFITTDVTGGDNGIAIDDFVLDNITLPVELVGISAMNENEKVIISWQTASELNNSHFSIERSSDGAHFWEIGAVNGAGTSFDFQDYSFTDKNPLPGKNYYRLRQVDFDGNFEFSKIIMVEIDARPTTKHYPSLATDVINLELATEIEEAAELLIFDNMGRLVAKHIIEAGAFTVQFPLSGLQAGQYVASLQGQGIVENFRFVKQ